MNPNDLRNTSAYKPASHQEAQDIKVAADALAARIQDTMQRAPVCVVGCIQDALDRAAKNGEGFSFVQGTTDYLANRDRAGLRMRVRDEALAFGASYTSWLAHGTTDPTTDAALNLCAALAFLTRVDHHPFRNAEGNRAAVAMAHESLDRVRLSWGVAA